MKDAKDCINMTEIRTAIDIIDNQIVELIASVESTIQYRQIYYLTMFHFPVIFKTQIYTDLRRFKVAYA